MPQEPASTIWTVGHSNHSAEHFLALLRRHDIDTLIDVRSYPYSRFAPHFNREQLAASLANTGIDYYFQGESLGGRPTDEDEYDAEGHALYDRMAARPDFRAAIGRILSGAHAHRIALLCAEGQPNDCHRRLLVGRVLTEHGIDLCHILGDGSIQRESEVKLCAEEDQTNLFGETSPWRSTQSVSHRRRQSASSAA